MVILTPNLLYPSPVCLVPHSGRIDTQSYHTELLEVHSHHWRFRDNQAG